jgi:hypothetical protein
MTIDKKFRAALPYFRGLLQQHQFIAKKARSLTVLKVWGALTRNAKLWRGIGRGRLPLEMRLAELTTAELNTLRVRVKREAERAKQQTTA